MNPEQTISEWLQSYDSTSDHERMRDALHAVLDLCSKWAERGPHSVRDHAGQDIRAAIARELGLSEEDNR